MADLLAPGTRIEKRRRTDLATTRVDGDKAYIESWDIYGRQESQTQAGYFPLGATSTKGCANCKWFVSPNSCILVSGDISPTGLSNLYAPIVPYVPEPMPVIIVGSKQEKSFFDKAKDAARSLLPGAVLEAPDVPLMFFQKDRATEQLRWFSVVTNNYEDREKAIFTSAAHKEMVQYVESTKQYPDLWMWHAGPDSKWGTTDWMDYDADNGFVVASGLVDAGKEHIAVALQEYGQKHALGTSHGFEGHQTLDKKYIVDYRMLEISPLPLENAANYGTRFGVSIKEIEEMAFTDARKTFLKDTMRVDDATIQTWETHVEELGAKMKDLGLSFKDMPEAPAAENPVPEVTVPIVPIVPVGTPVAPVEPVVVATEPVIEAKSADAAVVPTNEVIVALANVTDAVAQISTLLGTLVADQKALKEQVDAVGRSQDDQVASFFTSKMSKLPAAFDPTASPSNVTGEKSKEDDLAWFMESAKVEA